MLLFGDAPAELGEQSTISDLSGNGQRGDTAATRCWNASCERRPLTPPDRGHRTPCRRFGDMPLKWSRLVASRVRENLAGDCGRAPNSAFMNSAPNRPNVEACLCGLKDFQRDTVEYVYQPLFWTPTASADS